MSAERRWTEYVPGYEAEHAHRWLDPTVDRIDRPPREADDAGSFGGPHAGRGPRGYRRSDERIREDVCEALTWAPDVDASELEVTVTDGEVTLQGTVADRHQKRRAAHVAEQVAGVVVVLNGIRVHAGLEEGAAVGRGISRPAKRAGASERSG